MTLCTCGCPDYEHSYRQSNRAWGRYECGVGGCDCAAFERDAFVDVVFDGPPSHESGWFVEVENESGASVKAGEWIDRGDGYWALRLRALPSVEVSP